MNKSFLISFLFALAPITWLVGQKPTIAVTTECGKVVESEFTNNNEAQDVKLRLAAGDILDVNIIPIGNYLKVCAKVIDPGGTIIMDIKENTMYRTDKKSLIVKSEILSASGIYTIRISNYHPGNGFGKVGLYTVSVRCIKRDGQVIEPK